MTGSPRPEDVGRAPSILRKAFEVLDAFGQDSRVLTLTEIVRRTGMAKSTTYRVLSTLTELGVVERVGPGYKIGIRLLAMGALSLDTSVREGTLPYLERLRRVTRRTVHLAVLDGQDVVYLEKLTSHLSPPTPVLVGGRLPADQCSDGKVLLAFSAGVSTADSNRVRDRGWAVHHDEAWRSLACVAVPVRVGGGAVAAVSVAFDTSEGSGEIYLNPLRETAAALGRAIALSPNLIL